MSGNVKLIKGSSQGETGKKKKRGSTLGVAGMREAASFSACCGHLATI